MQLGVTQLQAKPAQVSSKAEPKSKIKEDTAGKYKKPKKTGEARTREYALIKWEFHAATNSVHV